MRPQIHLIDETWIDAAPQSVSAAVSDRANWGRWWPYLELAVTRNRGVKGIQFAAQPAGRTKRRSRFGRRPVELAGTVELWLEPFKQGVIVHHYLRLEPVGGRPLARRAGRRLNRELAWHAKRVFWQFKDELEAAG